MTVLSVAHISQLFETRSFFRLPFFKFNPLSSPWRNLNFLFIILYKNSKPGKSKLVKIYFIKILITFLLQCFSFLENFSLQFVRFLRCSFGWLLPLFMLLLFRSNINKSKQTWSEVKRVVLKSVVNNNKKLACT